MQLALSKFSTVPLESKSKRPQFIAHTLCRCGPKADIFAFANVLWEIVTQEIPIREAYRDANSPAECPAPIRDLIKRCRATEPLARPSADEVILSLQALCKHPSQCMFKASTAAAVLETDRGRAAHACTNHREARLPSVHCQLPEGLPRPNQLSLDEFIFAINPCLLNAFGSAGGGCHPALVEYDSRWPGRVPEPAGGTQAGLGSPQRPAQPAVCRGKGCQVHAHRPAPDLRLLF